MKLSVEERVKRGAAELDRRLPGWAFALNPLTLDLGDPCGCILGQLEGRYAEGVCTVFVAGYDGSFCYDCPQSVERKVRRLGFTVYKQPDENFDIKKMDDEFDELTSAWLREIADRTLT